MLLELPVLKPFFFRVSHVRAWWAWHNRDVKMDYGETQSSH